MIAMKIQNIYSDHLRSFKVFLDKVTRGTLNKLEINYGSKTLEYYYMMDGGDGKGNESFEYPNAIVDIQDIQPVDGVSPIARNAGMQINRSPHQVTIAENYTRNESVVLDKRWVNMMLSVQINTEDVTSLLNYHDLFMGYMPLQFFFFDYKMYTYIETTPFTEHWNFESDDIYNVDIRPDQTYRYKPEKYYLESHDHPGKNFDSQARDRELGGDLFTKQEGYRYFSTVEMEPILKLQSMQKQIDKETMKHSLLLNFELQVEIPNVLIGQIEYIIESIELVIDTANKTGIAHEYPLLTDMDNKFLINKNIQRGIIILPEDFHMDENPPYLEIKSDINLNTFTPSLWAVEDVTDATSKRFFIPLEHATVERVIDDAGKFVSLKFYFDEMEFFQKFNFKNNYNYLKLILFTEDAKRENCSPAG